MHANAANGTKRSHELESRSQRGRQSNHFDDEIRSSTLSHLMHSLNHALSSVVEVERLSTQVLGNLQPAIYVVNHKEMLWLMLQGRNRRTDADRTSADDYHDRLRYVQVRAELERTLDAKVTRGEDISHEDESLVRYALGGFHDGAIGCGNANEFSLTSIEFSRAEEETLRAARASSALAVEAFAAGIVSTSYIATIQGRSYQQVVKGLTTLSPTATVLTAGPISTTSPVNSWPMMNPVVEG